MGYLLYQIFKLETNNREIDFKKNQSISDFITIDEYLQIGRKLCKAVEVLNFDMKFQSNMVNVFYESDVFKLLLNDQIMIKEDVLKIINNCKSFSMSEFLDFIRYLNACISNFVELKEFSTKLNTEVAVLSKNASEQISNTNAFILVYMVDFSIMKWMLHANLALKIGANPDKNLKSLPGAWWSNSITEEDILKHKPQNKILNS
jgi:hypothetical protein